LSLLVIAPDAPPLGTGEKGGLPGCRLLLLPGNRGDLVRRLPAACVMSYGTSPKDSLTVSAMAGGRLSVSLQRELVTLAGGSVERQELVLTARPAGVSREGVLALAGVLLLTGTAAEEVEEIFGGRFLNCD
jgi:hypothetical protein